MKDEMKWTTALKKYRIKDTTWERMEVEYLDETPNFNPKIIDDVHFQQFYDMAYSIFYFGEKPLQMLEAKRIFKTWLMPYWVMFYGRTFIDICCKIVYIIRMFNLKKPNIPEQYINKIPSFEGKPPKKPT
jgi:hypothetical protein